MIQGEILYPFDPYIMAAQGPIEPADPISAEQTHNVREAKISEFRAPHLLRRAHMFQLGNLAQFGFIQIF